MIVLESLFLESHDLRIFRRMMTCFLLVLLFIPSLDAGWVFGQARFSILPDSDFRISGRSNESDFEVSSTEISGWIELSDAADPLSVTSLSITVPSREIKSDQGLIMNRVMWGSLNVDEHPNISFEMMSAAEPDVVSDSLNLVASGLLTLTGTTNEVTIELLAVSGAEGSNRYVGSFPLTMTDYGMTPPTAMFGRLRVHKDIRIHFDLIFGAATED